MDKLNIKYLKHNQIDFHRWDNTVSRSFNYHVYSLSSYLNIVTAGKWDALVAGDYEYIMPLPLKKKFFVQLSLQPKFTQQLGILSQHTITSKTVALFFKAIPPHIKYLELKLNKFNDTNLLETGEVRLNRNFELDLIQSYDSLRNLFSDNTKRNINKATKNGVKVVMTDSKTFFAFFKYHFGKQFGKALRKNDYAVLSKLLNFGNYHKYFTNLYYAAVDTNNNILATAFFIRYKRKLYYMDGVSSPEGRKQSAMFAIFDKAIRSHASQNLILDFEGSNIDSVARFYKGFGAIETTYPTVIINRLGLLADLKRK